ncbi:MAG: gliding motility protein GldN [Aureispira sp.]
MKKNIKTVALSLLIGLAAPLALFAQPNNNLTESGNVKKENPRDNFYDRYLHTEERVIPYDFVHEKDVFWEKRIWRLIDINEKRNHIFKDESNPFLNVLFDGAEQGDMTFYHVMDDRFSTSMTADEVRGLRFSKDTVYTIDPDTFEESWVVVENELNWEDIKHYRIKEVYFFDEETSTMGVRILGIAPIIERLDDNGNYLNSGPLFWAYYPEMREVLAQTEVFNPHNDAARMSWEDVFEARLFDSYIIKEGNVYNRRIKDYVNNPMDILLESQKIQESIFNFEHDLWSY